MKKVVAFLILCAMLLSVFVGCTPNSQTDGTTDDSNPSGTPGDFVIPEGMSGDDIVRLLLAGERLDSSVLKKDGDIFDDGAETFRKLAAKASSNLAESASALKMTPMRYKTLTPISASTLIDEGKGRVEIDGNKYIWSDFKENNNSYEAFANTTENIIVSSKTAADMIDYIKKNVRVVDKWVRFETSSFYLHVDENSEILLERWDNETSKRINICTRYKNAQGVDVYELYIEEAFVGSYTVSSRTTYIPGQRYEMSINQDFGDRVDESYFVADNSKGYWETYTISVLPTHYNISCFIMKDDIAYDAFYDPVSKTANYLKVMSADRATDIMHISGTDGDDVFFVDVLFSGFDGIESVELVADNDEIITDMDSYINMSPEDYEKYKLFLNDGGYILIGENSGVVKLTNGKTITPKSQYAGGKVTVARIVAEGEKERFVNGFVSLRIDANTYDELVIVLEQFLSECGIVCRRDTKLMLESIKRAYEELPLFTTYYKWNGVVVSDTEGIGKALEVEKTRFARIREIYEERENAPVIDGDNEQAMELNIHLSDIVLSERTGVRANGIVISVEKVTLSVSDTLLFVKDEPYRIGFALVSVNGGGLVHLGMSEESVAYNGGELSVTGSAELELSELVVGQYNLVAYVATSDGVRSTEYVKLPGDTADGEKMKLTDTSLSTSIGEDGLLIVSFEENTDISLSVSIPGPLTYAELYELMRSNAYTYGTPTDAPMEMRTGESFVSMSGEESGLAEGEYRIKYQKEKDGAILEGYIYLNLSISSDYETE